MQRTGGYDCKFVNTVPDDLLCVICLQPAREAQQTSCSCAKLLCFNCLKTVKDTSNACPTCRCKPIKAYPDTISTRRIKDMRVKCNNHPHCVWEGELRSLEGHSKNCSLESCKQCLKKVLAAELTTHTRNHCIMRQYNCPHCNEQGPYHQIVESHAEVCPEATLLCPNTPGCGQSIKRKHLQHHRSTCPKEKISCPYLSSLGCNVTFLREEVVEGKKKIQKSLDLAMLSVRKAKPTVLKVYKPDLIIEDDYNYSDDSDSDDHYSKSEPFYTHNRGYKVQLAIRYMSDFVSVRIQLADEEEDPEEDPEYYNEYQEHMEHQEDMHQPLTANVKITLLNQLDDANHHEGTIALDRWCLNNANDDCEMKQFIPIKDLNFNEEKNCQYLKNGFFHFKIETEILPSPPWLVTTDMSNSV